MDIIKNIFKHNPAKILEDFLKNRKINIFRQDGLTSDEEEYKIFDYIGEIKNRQELNVKNSFDLLEYLKPCFVYIASDIETIKEEVKNEHVDNLLMYRHYYFHITFCLSSHGDTYCMGHRDRSFKIGIFFWDYLNADKLINYIKMEIGQLGISFMFMFTKSTISFNINDKIYRSSQYMLRFLMEGLHNLNPKPIKKIIKAEKIFKEDVCAICLTNPAYILFCNCGHLCVCEECNKIGEGLEKCPICNTENTNLKIIE